MKYTVWTWKLSLAYGDFWDDDLRMKFVYFLPEVPETDSFYPPPDMAINIMDYQPKLMDYPKFLLNVLIESF